MPASASRPRPSRLSDLVGLVSRLRAAGCVFAEEEASLLTSSASGDALEALVVRRCAGEPLEHLLGWAGFAGLRVAVSPGVFVPRRRSELLVEGVVQWISGVESPPGPPKSTGVPQIRVLDLCCGSGAIGAAIADRLPGIEVWASDVSPEAVACARTNLPAERVVLGDLYEPLPDGMRFDVVVVNAPYVPSDAIATMPPEARDHEPRVALDGGADGVELHRRVAMGARERLTQGGVLVIETSRQQAELTAAACEAGGLTPRIEYDAERDATAVVAVSPR